MKYLIVSGDSFTDYNFRSTSYPDMDTSWPKWPELLAEKLGMECINLALCGKGNEYIYSTLQDQIVSMPNKDEIGLVIAAWSECHRRDYQRGGHYDNRNQSHDHWTNSNWHDEKIDSCGDLPYWAHRSLRYYSAFDILCERYNLPYIQFQMLDLYADFLQGSYSRGGKYPGNDIKDEKIVLKLILSYDKIINTTKFIGWPLVFKLGGWSLNVGALTGDGNQFDQEFYDFYTISKIDRHPNAAGQVKLAEYLYDWLETAA